MSNIFTLDTREVTLKWDVNNDGIVDISDLVLAGNHFGETGVGVIGDVNSDGQVDISDLDLIGSHFAKGQ